MPTSTNTEKRVVFGLKNFHYAILDESTSSYGSPKHVTGSVKLAVNAQGNNWKFFADDDNYYEEDDNQGYEGDLELANCPDEMLIDLCGYVYDANGVLVEDADAKYVKFALLCENQSNLSPIRHAFYECKFGRKNIEANTKSDNVNPDTQTIPISIQPHEITWGTGTKKIVHTKVPNDTDHATQYNGWYTNVYIPTMPSL